MIVMKDFGMNQTTLDILNPVGGKTMFSFLELSILQLKMNILLAPLFPASSTCAYGALPIR